jgi:hypothetical protein
MVELYLHSPICLHGVVLKQAQGELSLYIYSIIIYTHMSKCGILFLNFTHSILSAESLDCTTRTRVYNWTE